MEGSNVKRCKRCGEMKPATPEYFHRNNRRLDGLFGCCKVCENKRQQQRRAANPEPSRKACRKWRASHIEQEHERGRQYRLDNPHKVREAQKRYQAENWDRLREEKKLYRAANLDKDRVRSLNRLARQKSAEGTHTTSDIKVIYDSQRGKCWWCGCEVGGDYHVDHRIPLSRGGSNAPENLVISCPKCNRSKKDKFPHEWNGRLL